MEPFISTDDLETYVERTLDHDKAVIAVDSACQTIREAVEQDLNFVQDDEVTLDGTGTDTLFLPELPAIEITSLEGPGGELVEGTDFVVDLRLGAIRTKGRGRRFLTGYGIYTVIYSHGFTDEVESGMPDAPLWPSSVRLVALQIANRIYDQGIVKIESVGGSQTLYAQTDPTYLSAQEMKMIEKAIGIGSRRTGRAR